MLHKTFCNWSMAYVFSYRGTAVLIYVLHIDIGHTRHPLGVTAI